MGGSHPDSELHNSYSPIFFVYVVYTPAHVWHSHEVVSPAAAFDSLHLSILFLSVKV